MRLTLRLVLSLVLGLALVSLAFSYYQVRADKTQLRKDLERRAEVLAESLEQNAAPLLEKGSHKQLQRMVDRFGNREHLLGLVIYDAHESRLAVSSDLAERLIERPAAIDRAFRSGAGYGEFLRLGATTAHIYALPLRDGGSILGALAIVHDAGYIRAETQHVWKDTFLRVLAQGFVIALTTLLIVRWSITRPIARTAQWMRSLRTGRSTSRPNVPDWDVFSPLTNEVTTFAKSLVAARAAAEREAQLREHAESLWTAERLAIHVRSRLQKSRLFVVSNREPYMHVREGRVVRAVVPASGLVTALEPILRACDGTWIAHGSGDADKETVGRKDGLRVPPDDPKYTLRRIWLSKEEEEGYYYGFANEGLWPLCHIAHTRPAFRAGDWQRYQEVNHKFANAVIEEMAGTERPVLLAQDYHFALLPRIIKKERPDARVAIFWHIPWPNAEAFGICPWQRELLDGLLGADLIGFHLQSHCNNFLQSVDRAVESRIEWEHFAVNREDHLTVVQPFPISVDFAESALQDSTSESAYMDRAALFKELGVEASFLGVGVERVDYTKGILERFLALERLFEKYPMYVGKLTFVQIGAPSRTHIKRYHELLAEVGAEAERINWRFQTGNWKPIVYLQRQHSHQEIQRYYRTADVCMVTSLHDGMNLVAKEFVAARQDEQGVLVLSRFAGAARELRDALIVNPYDIEQMAEAVRVALEMSPEDKSARMKHMRRAVRENNIYRWAGNLVAQLCDVRVEKVSPTSQPTLSKAASL
ncbi:MAG: trehalose-6-phosphate synthase [Blastocatellia bacterium]|nr:MAG: trehalose-6-phosphate synthase [Blastocatellia bacterium]